MDYYGVLLLLSLKPTDFPQINYSANKVIRDTWLLRVKYDSAF